MRTALAPILLLTRFPLLFSSSASRLSPVPPFFLVVVFCYCRYIYELVDFNKPALVAIDKPAPNTGTKEASEKSTRFLVAT